MGALLSLLPNNYNIILPGPNNHHHHERDNFWRYFLSGIVRSILNHRLWRWKEPELGLKGPGPKLSDDKGHGGGVQAEEQLHSV